MQLKKFLICAIPVMFFCNFAVIAFAQDDVPEVVASPVATPLPEGDISGALSLLPALLKAFSSGNYPLGFGLLLMLSVFAARTWLIKKISKDWLSVFVAGLGVTGSVSASLIAGMPAYDATVNGLLVGTVAIGMWELLFKQLSKLMLKKKAAKKTKKTKKKTKK